LTPTILKPSTTMIDPTGKLDLTNNALITPGAAAAALDQIIGGQIFSSEPADPNKAIGYIDLSGADAGKFEVRYTLKGDANLDGAVDVGDLGALATSYGVTGGQSWANGDFNQDQNVDVGDLGALATNYGTQLAASPSQAAAVAAIAAPVPEPTAFTAISLSAAALLKRVRRQSSSRHETKRFIQC
jgi:hypothetical protein